MISINLNYFMKQFNCAHLLLNNTNNLYHNKIALRHYKRPKQAKIIVKISNVCRHLPGYFRDVFSD